MEQYPTDIRKGMNIVYGDVWRLGMEQFGNNELTDLWLLLKVSGFAYSFINLDKMLNYSKSLKEYSLDD